MSIQESQNEGYTDEKLIQGFASRNIPIFWGDKLVDTLFDSEAMVNLHLFGSLDEGLKEVERLDSDKDEYLRRLSVPAMRDPDYIERKYSGLEEFLVNIIEQPLLGARRRTESLWSTYFTDMYLNSLKDPSPKSKWNGLVRRLFG